MEGLGESMPFSEAHCANVLMVQSIMLLLKVVLSLHWQWNTPIGQFHEIDIQLSHISNGVPTTRWLVKMENGVRQEEWEKLGQGPYRCIKAE